MMRNDATMDADTNTETRRIQRIYDDRAPTYDRSCGIMERLLLGSLRQEFGALLQEETLEVAIGSGLNLPFYTSRITSATGVDLSAGMLAVARKRATSLGIAIALQQADAASLPFPNQSFDMVAISLALCTIPDPAGALRVLARVCRPGGHVILLEHVRSTAAPLAFLQRLLSPCNERAVGCHLDRDTLGLAVSLGFTPLSVVRRRAGIAMLAVLKPPAADRANLTSH
jgi:ubiquinone/menaquinone biosynthesis C-methylase UbiE